MNIEIELWQIKGLQLHNDVFDNYLAKKLFAFDIYIESKEFWKFEKFEAFRNQRGHSLILIDTKALMIRNSNDYIFYPQ